MVPPPHTQRGSTLDLLGSCGKCKPGSGSGDDNALSVRQLLVLHTVRRGSVARIIQGLSLIHETLLSGVAEPLKLSPAPDSLLALFGFGGCETSRPLHPCWRKGWGGSSGLAPWGQLTAPEQNRPTRAATICGGIPSSPVSVSSALDQHFLTLHRSGVVCPLLWLQNLERGQQCSKQTKQRL